MVIDVAEEWIEIVAQKTLLAAHQLVDDFPHTAGIAAEVDQIAFHVEDMAQYGRLRLFEYVRLDV